MTSLRSFQTEIQDIHNREVAKQRHHHVAIKDKATGVQSVAEEDGDPADEAVRAIEQSVIVSPPHNCQSIYELSHAS